jgi:hypothetical protein
MAMTAILQLVLLIRYFQRKQMNEITSVNSNGDLYPVKIDEEELKSRTDPLSFDVLRKSATESAFSGEYTDTETIGVYKCKACFAEYLGPIVNFTLAVDGHLFIRQQRMMQLNFLKIDHCFQELELKLDAHPVVHILDTFLLVRGMRYQQIKDGVSILWH